MTHRVLINGHPGTVIDVNDRGLHYGDGLFETMAVNEGHIGRLDLHLERLATGCARLGIAYPPRELLASELHGIATSAADARAVLKLVLTRGPGARGDDTGAPADSRRGPTRIISLHDWPDYPDDWHETGVTVRWCTTTLAVQPALAGIKHLNRLDLSLARREWTDPAIAEGLLCNTDGLVISGTKTNVFLIHRDVLATPRLDASGVNGTTRAVVLKRAGALGLRAREEALRPHDVATADEVFLTNALIGIWPVRQLGMHEYRIGPITRKLQNLVASA